MSYLWHLDGLSMALGIGELDGCTRSWNTKCHSIFFLNTNNSNNTNVFWHTDLTDLTDSLLLMFEHEIFFEHEFYEGEFYLAHGYHFFLRTDLISRILSLRLVVNDSSLCLLTRCGC